MTVAENRRLQAIANLPPIPSIAQNIISALNNHHLNIDSIADVLAKDPGLCARIVSAANSAFFTGQREIMTVKESVVRLGLSRVQVITTSILIGLRFKPENCPNFDIEYYWDNSINLALCATKLAPHARLEVPSEATYLCGLLHDIGLLIVSYLFPKEMNNIFQASASNPAIDFYALQRETLGFDCIEAGTDVAERWKLPSAVIEVIKNIHRTTEEEGVEYQNPRLINFMRLCHQWVNNGFESLPDITGFEEIPDKTFEFVSRSCKREQDQIDTFVNQIVLKAA